ncbi:hypothetical protein [Colwellia sp. TT2012]|nr:hypothetical protein [Colwellia sp. TT2012]
MSGIIIETAYVSIPLLGSVMLDGEISQNNDCHSMLSEGLDRFYSEVTKT